MSDSLKALADALKAAAEESDRDRLKDQEELAAMSSEMLQHQFKFCCKERRKVSAY
jgi:hypothetical protein